MGVSEEKWRWALGDVKASGRDEAWLDRFRDEAVRGKMTAHGASENASSVRAGLPWHGGTVRRAPPPQPRLMARPGLSPAPPPSPGVHTRLIPSPTTTPSMPTSPVGPPRHVNSSHPTHLPPPQQQQYRSVPTSPITPTQSGFAVAQLPPTQHRSPLASPMVPPVALESEAPPSRQPGWAQNVSAVAGEGTGGGWVLPQPPSRRRPLVATTTTEDAPS